ncbi:hypothetical protein L1D59_17875 [Pseudoalteromonas piscicida]|uniref:DUF6602 domain-containing protein n=1 Tax=Pseudoalteromonas piscicida TaxID=43662 RepID=UPI001EFC3802|nr:DUF6602 domain-containing protein [Pseudoalteromonas piscicida]MCG9770466.1 hypothetical protein [Pseudoalteromonas piscicida]
MANFIGEIVNQKVSHLKSSYEANKLISHQGVKGSLNEVLLLDLISSLIPNRYKLTNGIIQDSLGFQSNESDIIIYDSGILPPFLFGSSLGFIPAESVKYTFEVKSTLNSKELKSTIDKFSRLSACKGFDGITSLFAFSTNLRGKSELQRYYEADRSNFLTSPIVRVLVVDSKGYYHLNTTKVYLKDLVSKEVFLSNLIHHEAKGKGYIEINGQKIDLDYKINEINVHCKGDIIINNHNFDDLYIHVFRWYGVEPRDFDSASDNDSILAFLSGVSNTLCESPFGSYLIGEREYDLKVFSECIVDMWGNQSYHNVDFDGKIIPDLRNFKYSLQLDQEKSTGKLSLYPKE